MNTIHRSLNAPKLQVLNNALKACLSIGIIMLFADTAVAQSDCDPAYIFDGEGEHNRLGHIVASAGDVNNDGYEDFIIGAPEFSFGDDWDWRGRAYVFSGLNGDTLYVFTGESAGDRLGIAVSSAGDLNNDGYDDFIIGADLNSFADSSSGRVYVYSGKTGETLYLLDGESAGDRLGTAVAPAGDVNNDGYADFMVAATERTTDSVHFGMVYVFSGLNGDTLHVFTGDETGGLGWPSQSIASAGDVNNDGYDDIILGSQYNSANGIYTGRVFVFSGLNGDTLYVLTGDESSKYLGASVASAGDIDQDGYADFIVGAALPFSGTGRAIVLSGQTGDTLYDFIGKSSDNLGKSVASTGDINSDGYPDLLIGIPGRSAAVVFSGLNGDTLAIFEGESNFGFSLATAGDVNDHGYVDMIIGAYHFGRNSVGRVYIQRVMQTGDALSPASLCVGNTGNIDFDACDNVDIADLTVLIDHLFINFPPLVSPLEANVDGDPAGVIDIADLTYLIDHLFINFPPTAVCQ